MNVPGGIGTSFTPTEFSNASGFIRRVTGPPRISSGTVVEASIVKDRGTTFEQDLPLAIADDLAAHPDEPVSAELYRTLMYVTHIAPSFSLRGGTREILRGIIARGMGLR